MNYALVPYKKVNRAGIECWGLPENITSSIDLRKLEDITNPNAIGYAIAVYEDNVPEDALLFNDNNTRNRDLWLNTFGYRPEGDTIDDMLFSHLIDGADNDFANACRPLRCANIEELELHLGGKKVRKTNNRDKLQQAVLSRRDLDKIFDEVIAGKLPDGLHRKMLKREADKLGIDWKTLRSKNKRWQGENAEEPHTLLCSNFVDLNRFDIFDGRNWSVSGNTAAVDDFGWNSYLRHKGSLSSNDHQVELESVTYNSNGGNTGVLLRASTGDSDATIDGYMVCMYLRDMFIFSVTNTVWTILVGHANHVTVDTQPLKARCVGSAIGSLRFNNVSPPVWYEVTNTTHTAGVRTCAFQYKHTSSSARSIGGFRAYDAGDKSPTPSVVSPSTGALAGGTAVELTGINFDLRATVNFGGSSATSVVIFDDTKITAVSPAGTGIVDVGVTTGSGSFYSSKVNGFTYAAPGPPTVLNPSFTTGVINSLFTTTISGTNTPTLYSGINLPTWMYINTGNGLLSGLPPVGSTKNLIFTIYAINSNGSGSKDITLNLNKTPNASGFTTKARASRPYSQGGKTIFTGGTIIYQSGQSKLAQNPDIGGRLDQFRYYGG